MNTQPSVRTMPVDDLHLIGQSNGSKVGPNFVNNGIPTAPLVQDSALDRGIQTSGTAALRNHLGSNNAANGTSGQ